MKELDTGKETLDKFYDAFFEKYGNENGQCEGFTFWPANLVKEAYEKAAGQIGGANEGQALKAFYNDMVKFLSVAGRFSFDPGEEEYILAFLSGIVEPPKEEAVNETV